jgi:hypothetical protein
MTNDTTSTKETVMKTQFSIEMYQVSHGKLPRGKGCWGFATEKMPFDYSNVYFSQYLPLSAAKKEALRRFPTASTLYILP